MADEKINVRVTTELIEDGVVTSVNVKKMPFVLLGTATRTSDANIEMSTMVIGKVSLETAGAAIEGIIRSVVEEMKVIKKDKAALTRFTIDLVNAITEIGLEYIDKLGEEE